MSANDFSEKNPPAFPLPLGTMDRAEPSESGGMTLRDYFAGQALQGMLATPSVPISNRFPTVGDSYASAAYGYADAMLKARWDKP